MISLVLLDKGIYTFNFAVDLSVAGHDFPALLQA